MNNNICFFHVAARNCMANGNFRSMIDSNAYRVYARSTYRGAARATIPNTNRYRCAQSPTNREIKLNKSKRGGWARQREGVARGTTLCLLSPVVYTDDRSRVRPYGRGILVYDSNPDESLKRDFQDCAPVTRRNDPARKNLPTNDPKLLAVYKLQSAWAEVISPVRPRTSDESRFHLVAVRLIVNDC